MQLEWRALDAIREEVRVAPQQFAVWFRNEISALRDSKINSLCFGNVAAQLVQS